MTKLPQSAQIAIPKSRDPDFNSLLRFLRFGKGNHDCIPLFGYTSISRLTCLSISHVRKLLANNDPSKYISSSNTHLRSKRFNQEHISFLVSSCTLRQWAPYTLIQRAIFFHRRFPEVKISASSIRRIYIQYGVKYKAIRRGKKLIDITIEPYKTLFTELLKKVRSCLETEMPIVFTDEAVFTYNTFQAKAWAPKGDNINFEDRMTSIKTQAVVAGYSREKGLEALHICPSAVRTPQFITFLEHVSERHNGKRFAVFLDNLSVHKSRQAIIAYERLNIEPVFNLPYSPQYNGIESIFSIANQYYKKLLLEVLVNKKFINPRRLICTAFDMISREHSTNCLRHGLSELMK